MVAMLRHRHRVAVATRGSKWNIERGNAGCKMMRCEDRRKLESANSARGGMLGELRLRRRVRIRTLCALVRVEGYDGRSTSSYKALYKLVVSG